MASNILPIKPVSKDLLYMKVADAIHRYIHDNHLQPGDKIPSERMLAEQLQTGRNSVREALRVLEHEGILEVKTGRGAFIVDKSSADPLYEKLFRGNYFELLEIKSVLERAVICRVTKKATGEQLDTLDKLLSDVEEEAAKGIYAEKLDQLFHRKILSICENRSMERMISSLIDLLTNYAAYIDDAGDIFISTIPYHRQMLEAMKKRDVDKACTAYDNILRVDMTALEDIVSDEIPEYTK